MTSVLSDPATTTLDDAMILAFLHDEIPAESLPDPAWGPLGKVVYERTYSRDVYLVRPDGTLSLDDAGNPIPQAWWSWSLPTNGRTKEVWAETCRRVTLGSLSYDTTLSLAEREAEAVELFGHLFTFKITPAGRHLWATGTGSPWSRNCWSAPFGPRTSDHFRFGAMRLFEGGGVGSNYSADQLALTTPLDTLLKLSISCNTEHKDFSDVAAAVNGTFAQSDSLADERIVVEDSREGWVAAWCRLIDLAMSGRGQVSVIMDVSQVRPFGAPLQTFGGTASGPAPLVGASLKMVETLNAAASEHRRLRGLEAMDIDHEIAAAVVAGGARRCLPWYTRVNTARGSVQIKDIQVGDEVLTPKGRKAVTAVFDQGRQGLVLIKHQMGELECTPNHRVAVYNSLGNWTFKRAGKLTENDHLVWDYKGTSAGINIAPAVAHPIAGRVEAHVGVTSESQRFPDQTCSVQGCPSVGAVTKGENPLCNTHYLRQRKWGDPLLKTNHGVVGFETPELTTDFAWMVGLLQGDGNVLLRDGVPHKVSFAMSNEHEAMSQRLVTTLSRFGNPRRYEHGENCHVIALSNRRFADWCFAHVKQASAPLHVPEWIFQADAEIRSAYLAGLFDSDGSCKTRPLNIVTTVYHSLVADLIRLGASLGIPLVSRQQMRPNDWQPIWSVNAVGRQAYAQAADLLAKHSSKFERVERTHTGAGRNFGFEQTFARQHGARAYGGEGNVIIPVAELERQGHDLGGAYPTRVLSVTPLPYQEQTYDIEVEGIHQFTAEGLVVHNSARMSLMSWTSPEIFSFISCKADFIHHWTTNISVEIDEAFRDALAIGDPHATKVYEAVCAGIVANGEPGLVDTGVINSTRNRSRGNDVRHVNPCALGSTKLLTDRGLVRIDELAGTEFKIWNGVSWTDSSAWSTGIKPVFEVTLSSGEKITTTADHRFAVKKDRRSQEIVEVEAADLLNRRIVFFPGDPWEGEDDLSADEALLLGILQGDGNFSSGRGITVHTREDEVVAVLKQFGFHEASEGHWYAGTDSVAANLCRDFGMHNASLPERTLPEAIFTSTPATVRAFLRGLYAANGAALVGYNRVTLKTTCRDMAGEVQMLLSALGMRGYITTNKPSDIEWENGTFTSQESYDVSITRADSLAEFGRQIGFIHRHKLEAFSNFTPRAFSRPRSATVVSVEPVGEAEVFDFHEPERHWGWANGFQIHNCGEATLETRPGTLDEPGSGESCNLGHVNLDAFGTDLDGALRAFELVGRFLYRATLNMPTEESAARIERDNRRIGAGIYGFQGWLAAHGTRMSEFPHDTARQDDLRAGQAHAYAAACEVADRNGTPHPISATVIAPTGSIAQLSGATASINPVYSPYFIRRVRFGSADPAWQEAQAQGYTVEKDIYADNTMVVEYPTRDAILDRFDEDLIEGSFDIDFGTYMRIVAAVQTSLCGGELGQAVSHTAQLEPNTDPVELAEALRPLLGTIKGVTAFPAISRPMSPLEAITREEMDEYARFREIVVGDSNDGACSPNGSCPVR